MILFSYYFTEMFTTALQNREFTNVVANSTLSTLTIMTDNKLNCI